MKWTKVGDKVKKTIGLAGAETSFLHRLMDYVNSRGEAEAFLCTREDELLDEVRQRDPAVVFCMEDFAKNLELSDLRVNFVSDNSFGEGIYQYQSASSLYTQMRRHIWKETSKRIVTAEEKKLMAVYSPIGRSGKTSFALAYAKEHSFFYIGMEEYGILTNNYFSDGGLLYHIKNRKTGIVSYLTERMEERDGVCMIGSPVLFTDIRQIEAEDFSWFLSQIREDSNIPSVMIDFGSNSLVYLEVLDLFDQVFIPVLSGETEERKLRQFKDILYEVNGRMDGRIKEIIVPAVSWRTPDFLSKIRYMDGLSYE